MCFAYQFIYIYYILQNSKIFIVATFKLFKLESKLMYTEIQNTWGAFAAFIDVKAKTFFALIDTSDSGNQL